MIYETLAAVDLGSNSFRLQVGRVVGDQIYPLDSMKEPVRLAAGLNAEKRLDQASQERALATLNRFSERLRGFSPNAVRAVATNTLRVAKNAPDFLPLAEKTLGFPIEVIAGREEARLIYMGAASSLPPSEDKRLVVDIGGGSTEFIIGLHQEPLLTESLYMGCVSYTLRFFPDRQITKSSFREAKVAATKELELITHDCRQMGWQQAIGCSGTARAIADILEINGLNPDGKMGITAVGLEKLSHMLVKAGSAEALHLEGVKTDRLYVLPGGIAILSAVLETLGIEAMDYAEGALRQGVLYDLLGRFQQHDMRNATVQHFQQRYQVDKAQAARIAATASAILKDILSEKKGSTEESDQDYLAWAAALHEIGISVAHNAYHKHGAYILNYADMPGFSKKEQARLATLVLAHRGKLEKVNDIPLSDSRWQLIFALRLAVLLHRSRDDRGLPSWRIKKQAQGFSLELPAAWLSKNPWTAAALVDEEKAWQQIGWDYRIKARAAEKQN